MKTAKEILSEITGYSVEELTERNTEPLLQAEDCLSAMKCFLEQQQVEITKEADSLNDTETQQIEQFGCSGLKIFELRWTSQDEKEWISGNTIIEALKTYLSVTGTDIVDLEDEDDIVELPKEEWSKMTVRNIEYDENDPDYFEEMTFEQWMKENPKSDIIAGTMYD